jgi:hypothetical protein
MNKFLLAGTAMALAATFSSPAYAQEEPDEFWEGLHVGGTFGLGAQPNDGGQSVLFDTNRDGVYGDTVRTADESIPAGIRWNRLPEKRSEVPPEQHPADRDGAFLTQE